MNYLKILIVTLIIVAIFMSIKNGFSTPHDEAEFNKMVANLNMSNSVIGGLIAAILLSALIVFPGLFKQVLTYFDKFVQQR